MMRHVRLFTLLLAAVLSLAAIPALAQAAPTPINLGDNLLGEISATQLTQTYALTSDVQIVDIQVLGVTSGFVPFVRVFDPAGALAQSVPNPTLSNTVNTTLAITQPGAYTIEVSSGNGGAGQFLVSVQGSAAPATDLVPLPMNEPVPAAVNAEAPLRTFTFTADPTQMLLLSVTSDYPAGGPGVTLRDAETGEVVGVGGMRLTAIEFRIPGGHGFYRVDIAHSGSPFDETFTVLLQLAQSATAQPTATQPTQVSVPQGGACLAASADGDRINVRALPSTDAAVLGQFQAGQFIPVTGRLGDSSWYQVNLNGQTGWVAGFVVTLGGACGGLPVIAAPSSQPGATLIPTQPAPTQPQPASTPDVAPTDDNDNDQGGTPDLTITSADISYDENGASIVVTVANIGDGTAGANELHAQFPNFDIVQQNLPELEAGEGITMTFNNPNSTMGGDWQANVDAIGVVAESNEGNNHAGGSVP